MQMSHPAASGGEFEPERLKTSLFRIFLFLLLVPDWRAFLQGGIEEKENQRIRKHERTGRPLGDEGFINNIENATN